MTAIILLILGIRLKVLRLTTGHALVAAARWHAHRQRCAGSLTHLSRCARWLRCVRCVCSNRESDDFLVYP